jgi:hypothetical protein
MDCLTKVLKLLVLCAVLMAPAGCATSTPTYDDNPTLEPTPSHEDESHGWGTGIASPN